MKKSDFKNGLNADLKSNSIGLKVISVSENENFNTVINFDSVIRSTDIEFLRKRFSKSHIIFSATSITLKPI